MRITYLLLPALFILTACSHSYYIVRHAEKAGPGNSATMMNDDPPLTKAGEQRAEALKDSLKDKRIHYIFSTNTIRTKSTAEPLRAYLGLETVIYAKPDSGFIARLKKIKKNTLIVGHSNTVDDLINGLLGKQTLTDLKDSEYDNVFEVVYKKKLFGSTHASYIRWKYGFQY